MWKQWENLWKHEVKRENLRKNEVNHENHDISLFFLNLGELSIWVSKDQYIPVVPAVTSHLQIINPIFWNHAAGYMCTCVYVAKALAACPGALCWDARERGGLYVLVIEIAMDHKKWMVNICKHHDLIWFTYCNTLKRSTSRCEIARGYIYIYHGYDAMHAYIYIYTRL